MRAIPRDVIKFGLPFVVILIGRLLGAPEHPFAEHNGPLAATRGMAEAPVHSPVGVMSAPAKRETIRITLASSVRTPWSDSTRIRFHRVEQSAAHY